MDVKLSEITHPDPVRDHGKTEFEELKKSIQNRGLLEPLVLNQDKKLLCGRGRI